MKRCTDLPLVSETTGSMATQRTRILKRNLFWGGVELFDPQLTSCWGLPILSSLSSTASPSRPSIHPPPQLVSRSGLQRVFIHVRMTFLYYVWTLFVVSFSCYFRVIRHFYIIAESHKFLVCSLIPKLNCLAYIFMHRRFKSPIGRQVLEKKERLKLTQPKT